MSPASAPSRPHTALPRESRRAGRPNSENVYTPSFFGGVAGGQIVKMSGMARAIPAVWRARLWPNRVCMGGGWQPLARGAHRFVAWMHASQGCVPCPRQELVRLSVGTGVLSEPAAVTRAPKRPGWPEQSLTVRHVGDSEPPTPYTPQPPASRRSTECKQFQICKHDMHV